MRYCLFWMICLLVFPSAHGQIHADVTVSQDGNTLGTFRILLHHGKAPRTVANFVGLATGERTWVDPENGAVREGVPFYDGVTFHRLIHNFMIQGGDPLGTGGGGPGYVFQDEFDDTLRHDGAYRVSMANSGVNSNGSQFFITFGATEYLNDLHSVFGTVIDDATHPNGRALIDGFMSETDFPTGEKDRPLTPIVIESVEVSGPDLAGFDVSDPALGLPAVKRQWVRVASRSDGTFLVWDRLDRHESPVRVSGDLAGWGLAGNVLSMGTETAAEVEVTSLVNSGATFFSFPTVDYSHTRVLPQNIFQDGDVVAFETGGGTLTVEFDGAGGGSWSFDDGEGGVQSGAIENYGLPSESPLPGIPSSGILINGQGSYARALSAREVVIFFDGPAGPEQLTAIQPSLSFHAEGEGWYTGPVNSELSSPAPFKGRFIWTPAP